MFQRIKFPFKRIKFAFQRIGFAFQRIKFSFKRIKFSFHTSKFYLTESSYCNKLVIAVLHRGNIAISYRDLIRNDDGNGIVIKAIGLISKTTTLHVHDAFL